jgi:hypothetical protein
MHDQSFRRSFRGCVYRWLGVRSIRSCALLQFLLFCMDRFLRFGLRPHCEISFVFGHLRLHAGGVVQGGHVCALPSAGLRSAEMRKAYFSASGLTGEPTALVTARGGAANMKL